MSRETEDIKIQIQRTLMNINDVTCKIKQELGLINEMVKARGNLTITIDEANAILAKVAKNRSITTADELLDTQNEENLDDFNLLESVNMDEITQKLMAIMDT